MPRKQIEAARRTVQALTPQQHITVKTLDGVEFGNFISSDVEGFTFFDVDSSASVRLRYDQVRRIKRGYGGYNSVTHRHTDRTRSLIVGAAVIGALAALIVVAAGS